MCNGQISNRDIWLDHAMLAPEDRAFTHDEQGRFHRAKAIVLGFDNDELVEICDIATKAPIARA